MEIKTIALDREAYDLLKAQKASGESFSDVVKRLAGRRRPLSDYAGIWKEIPKGELKKIEEALERGRELDRERLSKLLRRLG